MVDSLEVLLASDFTARSDRPLDRAAQIAEQKGASLVIAHILEGNRIENDDTEMIRRQLRADLPDHAADTQIVLGIGSAPRALAEIAQERGSDLIVAGVARYNSVGDFVLGTAVDHIIRNADAPVLVVRRRPRQPYGHMLLATDLSDCAREAMLAAAALFPELGLTVVHAFHVPYEGWLKSDDVRDDVRKDSAAQLDAWLAHPDIAPLRGRIAAVIDEGDTDVVVTRQLEETGADLLVLGTRARGGIAHAVIGSQAEALLDVVNVDVLVVRERDA